MTMTPGTERLAHAMLLYVRRQGTQGTEDFLVVLVVRLELEPVLVRNRERKLECVYRIETETFTKQGSLGVDLLGTDILEVERIDDKLCNFFFKNRSRHLESPDQKRLKRRKAGAQN